MVHFQKKRRTQNQPQPPPTGADLLGDKVVIKFQDAEQQAIGDNIEVSLDTSRDDLLQLLKSLLDDDARLDEYCLVLADSGLEVIQSLRQTFHNGLNNGKTMSTEGTLTINYYSLAPFKVRPVTRLAGSLRGHNGTVLCLSFSPNGVMMATGSGDCEVRLWDLTTTTPVCVLKGHTRPVVSITWSPDAKWLATGSEDKTVRVWRAADCNSTNTPTSRILRLHQDTITALEFMPLHLSEYWRSQTPLLLSAARDGSIKIWDIMQGQVVSHLNGHTKMVTSVKWSGLLTGTFDGQIETGPFVYSSSRDMTIRVWKATDGMPLVNIVSHGHWVNKLSCNTDGLIRYGPFDHKGDRQFKSFEEMAETAKKNWQFGFKNLGEERVVTCSDDNTLAMWNLLKSTQKITQMTGHQKAVCHVCFSPNGRYLLSGGFDSAIRLWDGRTGKYLHTYRGHVGPVYQLSWAADSRLFVSCSRDSTLKVWDTADGGRKLKEDLPGAADEIYAVEWSPDCAHVGSGGKDKIVRIWCH